MGFAGEAKSDPPNIGVTMSHPTVRNRVPLGSTARTGQICPESGVWGVVGVPTTTAPIAKGNKMPPYRQRAVTWVLARYA